MAEGRSEPNREMRRLAGRKGGHTSWANTVDRSARTAPAREAARLRFEKIVDPDGELDPALRAKLAENARKAFLADMSIRAAQARRRRAS